MRLKNLVLIVALLFIISVVYAAASLVVSAEKEVGVAEAGGEAVFIVTIKNTQTRNDILQLSVDPFQVAPFSDIVEKVSYPDGNTVNIAANEEKKVKVKVRYKENVKTERNYITTLLIESLQNENVKTEIGLSAYVISSREIVSINAEFPENIIPGKKEELIVTLKNNGNLALKNADLLITSSGFNIEEKFELEPLEEQEYKLKFKVDEKTKPSEYSMSIRVFQDGALKGSENFDFTVIENPDIKEVQESRTGFLSYVVEINERNEGNTIIKKTFKHPISTFSSWFTKTEPYSEVYEENNEKFYKWNIEINPGGRYNIKITTDYKLLFFTIVFVLILIGLFVYFSKKDIGIKKSLYKISTDKENKISEMKVLLNVKNRTHKEFYNVKVIDLIPRFMEIDMDFGTLKPSKIQKGTAGIRLIWEISKIDPGDDRLISYKVKTQLPLVGKINLPPAVAQYYGRKKQIVNSKSNRLTFRL